MLNELKEKIYKLLPDLKKLEFGCEVEYKIHSKCSGKYKILHNARRNPKIDQDCFYAIDLSRWTKSWIKIKDNDVFKIIGKPIRIDAILMAIEKANIKYTDIGLYGTLITIVVKGKDGKLFAIHWQLNKILDEQEDIVIGRLTRAFN